MAGVIRLDALVQLEKRKITPSRDQDSQHVLSASAVGSLRCCSDAVSTLSPQLDAKRMQKGYRRLSQAVMIRTRKTEKPASAISRLPSFPPSWWKRKWPLINVQGLIGLCLTSETQRPAGAANSCGRHNATLTHQISEVCGRNLS